MVSSAAAGNTAPLSGPQAVSKTPGQTGVLAPRPVERRDRNRDLASLRAAIARIEGTPAVRLDAIDAGAVVSRARSPAAKSSHPNSQGVDREKNQADAPCDAPLGKPHDRTASGGTDAVLIEGHAGAKKPFDGTSHATDAALARRSRMQGLALGCPEADRALGGGFPAAGLSEIHLDETRDGGSLAGFALALAIRFAASPARPLLWIADDHALSEAGRLYGPGLTAFGLDPGALFLVRTRRLEDAAWAGEEAAISPALAMAVLEVRGNPPRLGLEGTRRLHLRAREAGVPFLLLRQGARPETTAAPLRLRIRPGPAATIADLPDEARLIGHPVFSIALEKSPGGRPQHFDLEWNPHERRFGSVPKARFAPLSRHPSAAVGDGPDPAREAGTIMALRRAS